MIINLPDTDDINKNITDITTDVLVLQDELTANNTKLYFDYKDGKYGYNTDPNRGADTFNPFKSDPVSEDIYTNLTTVRSYAGDSLPTITGNGYITLRRTAGSGASALNVFIDGNTKAFTISSLAENNSVQGGFWTFFFQKSIRFTGEGSESYFYQTLLADGAVGDKYTITQNMTTTTDYTTITGKGKILISPAGGGRTMDYSIDGVSEVSFKFHGYQYMEFMFNKSFKFKPDYINNTLYYIVYLEK